MVCPGIIEFVATELEKTAKIDKQARKAGREGTPPHFQDQQRRRAPTPGFLGQSGRWTRGPPSVALEWPVVTSGRRRRAKYREGQGLRLHSFDFSLSQELAVHS